MIGFEMSVVLAPAEPGDKKPDATYRLACVVADLDRAEAELRAAIEIDGRILAAELRHSFTPPGYSCPACGHRWELHAGGNSGCTAFVQGQPFHCRCGLTKDGADDQPQ